MSDRVIALAISAALSVGPALAHDWYDPSCCNGMDCQPVHPDRVIITRDGLRVQVGPGQHPLAHSQIDVLVPWGDPRIMPSQDSDVHVCISQLANLLYCVYLPPAGV